MSSRPPDKDVFEPGAAAEWETLVESSLARASTPATREGLCPLPMKRTPNPIWLPAKRRTIAEIAPNLRKILRALVSGEARWPLFLWGVPGVGKTCASLLMLDYGGGLYFTADGLCEAIALSWKTGEIPTPTGRPIGPTAFWKELEAGSLVVLDEIGQRGDPSYHHYSTVKRVLDAREGRPLVLIANHDLEAIAGIYDDRIASRMAAGTVFELQGADRRVAKPALVPFGDHAEALKALTPGTSPTVRARKRKKNEGEENR